MKVLMVIGHICLKRVSLLETLVAKEKVVTILTQMTILHYLFAARKTLKLAIQWPQRRVKYCLHRMITRMTLKFGIHTLEKAFLT